MRPHEGCTYRFAEPAISGGKTIELRLAAVQEALTEERAASVHHFDGVRYVHFLFFSFIVGICIAPPRTLGSWGWLRCQQFAAQLGFRSRELAG